MNELDTAALATDIESRVGRIPGVVKLFPPRNGVLEAGRAILRGGSRQEPLVRIRHDGDACSIELDIAVTVTSQAPNLARLVKTEVVDRAVQHGIHRPRVRITVSHLPAE